MINHSFRNPYLIFVIAIFVAVISFVIVPRMPVDALPQFKKSAMQILTLYPGMPTEVVEKDITSRMERWTGQSNGILKQESKSLMGVSIVTNYYQEDVTAAEAMANTSSYAMSDMYYQPPGTLPPMVQPFDPTASKPLMLLTVSSNERTGKELYDLAYYSLRQMLSGVKGVIAPAAYGGSKRRIYIYVDPHKIESLGISQTQISEALLKNTTMIPSGIAELGDLTYAIDAQGMIKNIKDFNDIVITYKDNVPIFVKDIGIASDASAIQTNIVRVDGKEQVYLPIFKRQGANTIASVQEVKNALPEIKDRMPSDVNLNVIFDQSIYVKQSISSLVFSAFSGLILVILVLLFFLGNYRSAFIVSISIPLSIMTAFIVLYLTGQSINSITLGGIALVLGLLVDNSIVVLENIDRHLKMGKKSLTASLDAAKEVSTPVLASTLVIVVVFIPTLFLTGIAKDLFSPLSLTVAGAMLGSYVFSLTLIPILASKLFGKDKTHYEQNKFVWFQKFIERQKESYKRNLCLVIEKKAFYLTLLFFIFCLSLFGFFNLGYELFPKVDVGQMEIMVRKESGTQLKSTAKTIAKMEEIIKEELGTDLAQIVSNIGVFYDLPAAYTPNSGTQDAFIKVQLSKKKQMPTDDYVDILRSRFLRDFPGVEVSFNTGGLITAALNEGKTSPIDIQIKGNKLEVLRSLAERMRDTINDIPETRDVRILQRIDQPTKEIDIDRVKASELGVDPVDAIQNLVSALNSSATFNKSFWIDENNGNHYYVGVTYPESEINTEHTLDNVVATSKLGDPVPYKLFSKITDTSQPVEINHHNLTREFNVYANIAHADIGSVSSQISNRIDEFKKSLPKGYQINFEGEMAIIQQSFGNLWLGLFLAVLFSFLIITPLFKSFKKPLIIILVFPMGIIGVVALMLLTGTNLSIQSIMGIITMVGISVSYGNILIDRINKLINEGLPMQKAIINGSLDRFRPIIMTAFTTIFGLLPTALGFGDVGGANSPLAIAVIGGTGAATLLTLYIVPVIYLITIKNNN